MIKIRGIEYKFSFTSPAHVKRFKEAQARVESQAAPMLERTRDFAATMGRDDVDNSEFLESYIKVLEDVCLLYANLIDDTLGQGTANSVFGDELDMEELTDFWWEFDEAISKEAERFTSKMGVAMPVGTKGGK